MISICLATRKRPECFKKLCSTALELADKPDNIEFVSYHDLDDDSVYEYMGNHLEVYGDRELEIFKMANECQRRAKGPIYMFTADDFYFETKGWDTEVEKAFEQYEDRIVLVCPDGKYWKNWRISVIGFLHKNWIDAVGYLLPPYDGGQAADRWINYMAVALDRRVRLTIKVTHTNTKDDVHREKNKRCLKQAWSKKFWSAEMEEQRKKDTELLKQYIIERQVNEYQQNDNLLLQQSGISRI
jgi:hypothetical protein